MSLGGASGAISTISVRMDLFVRRARPEKKTIIISNDKNNNVRLFSHAHFFSLLRREGWV